MIDKNDVLVYLHLICLLRSKRHLLLKEKTKSGVESLLPCLLSHRQKSEGGKAQSSACRAH